MDSHMQKIWEQLSSLIPTLIGYAGRAVAAILVLLVGWWIINLVLKGFTKAMQVRKVEPTLQGFVQSVVGLMLKALLLISVASMVGIATTSFVAVLGAAGLAVGMALQGSLANFAGGVLILLFRPFKAGDYITCGGVSGTVVSIEMFRTILRALNNDIIYVPNGTLSNGIVLNNTEHDLRWGTINILIDYNDDVDQARELLLAMFKEDERISTSSAPYVTFSPKVANISVSINFLSSTNYTTALTNQYSEEAIQILKANGYHLGTTTRAAPVAAS